MASTAIAIPLFLTAGWTRRDGGRAAALYSSLSLPTETSLSPDVIFLVFVLSVGGALGMGGQLAGRLPGGSATNPNSAILQLYTFSSRWKTANPDARTGVRIGATSPGSWISICIWPTWQCQLKVIDLSESKIGFSAFSMSTLSRRREEQEMRGAGEQQEMRGAGEQQERSGSRRAAGDEQEMRGAGEQQERRSVQRRGER